MASIESHPHLRLVGLEEARRSPVQQARRVVTEENRAAARNLDLDAADPRWVLAARAYSQLEGSALTFDRRQKLMRTARQLGVRPFDANVIVAVVQDHARRGRRLDEAAGTIALLDPPPAPARSLVADPIVLRWLAALAAALAANSLLIWWLTA